MRTGCNASAHRDNESVDLVVRQPTGIFDEEARTWRVPPRLATALFVLPAAGLLLGVVRIVDRDLARFLLDEDSVIEWGTSLAIVAVAVLAAVVARTLWRDGRRAQAVAYAFLAVASVLAAGEEISWGQRLLGLETPEVLEEVNRQGEITFHNIGETLTAFNLLLFFGSLYGIAAEWIERRWHLAGRMADGDRLYVPPFFLSGLFAVMVGYRFVRTLLLNQESYALTSLSEWAELCFATALFVTVLLSARWVSQRESARLEPTAA